MTTWYDRGGLALSGKGSRGQAPSPSLSFAGADDCSLDNVAALLIVSSCLMRLIATRSPSTLWKEVASPAVATVGFFSNLFEGGNLFAKCANFSHSSLKFLVFKRWRVWQARLFASTVHRS